MGIYTSKSGYEFISFGGVKVRLHRLVACIDNDPADVFANTNTEVHHKNSVKWDNRPENLELLTHREHAKKHWNDRFEKKEFHDKDRLRSLYHDEDLSLKELGEMFDCTSVAISYWINKYGIERKKKGREIVAEANIEKMYNDGGKSISDIASELSVAERRVWEYMDEHEIERKQGNWKQVCGEDHHQYLSPNKMLDDVIEVHAELGHWPNTREYKENGKHSLTSLYEKFDSFSDFKAQAKERLCNERNLKAN